MNSYYEKGPKLTVTQRCDLTYFTENFLIDNIKINKSIIKKNLILFVFND